MYRAFSSHNLNLFFSVDSIVLQQMAILKRDSQQLLAQNNFSSAETKYRELSHLIGESFGITSEDYLLLQSEIADICVAREKYQEALNIQKSIYRTRSVKDSTMDDSPQKTNVLSTSTDKDEKLTSSTPSRETLKALHDASKSAFNTGDYTAAAEMAQDCLSQRIQYFGENDPDTIQSAISTSTIFNSLGLWEEAYRLISQACALSDALLKKDPENLIYIKAKITKANLLCEAQRQEEAIDIYRGMMSIMSKTHRYDDIDFLELKTALAIALKDYVKQNPKDYQLLNESVELLSKTAEIFATKYGDTSVRYLRVLTHLASVFATAQHYDRGIEIQEGVCKTLETCRPNHHSLVPAYYTLGTLYTLSSSFASGSNTKYSSDVSSHKAHGAFNMALNLSKKIHGPDSWITQSLEKQLTSLVDPDLASEYLENTLQEQRQKSNFIDSQDSSRSDEEGCENTLLGFSNLEMETETESESRTQSGKMFPQMEPQLETI